MNKVANLKKKEQEQPEKASASASFGTKIKMGMGSEIEEIFASKKRKRLEKEKKGEDEKPSKVVVAANVRPSDKKKGKSSKPRSLEEKSSATAHRTSQSRKKTADGLTIFTEEELGVGKADAGGTALCPFDCDCCF